MRGGLGIAGRLGLLLVLPGAVGGCGGGELPPVRGPSPVPWADTLPIREPEARVYVEKVNQLRQSLVHAVAHDVSFRKLVSGPGEALNVDAFDEVVPSAWYRSRITAGELTPAEVRRGPPGGPPAEGPLTVVDAKVEGVTPGFTVQDSRGDRFLLKFDPPAYPGLASGADAVVSRIFWAAGYNVPSDVVLDLDRERLVVGEDVMVELAAADRPLRTEDVDTILERAAVNPDGTVRTLSSRFLEGTPKGPFSFEGTWEDDPNDYYPHEHRRELRGMWTVAAWVNHVDLRPGNTLDTWIEPTGYIRHHLIDFGTTLGSGSVRVMNPREGMENQVDVWPIFGRILTLGLYRVGWEGEPHTVVHPSLGFIRRSFDPDRWRPYWPNEAFRRMTPADGYWGAKRVAAFDTAHVRAAVEAAAYRDPGATETLVDILLTRRRDVLEHWFGRVTPIEEVEAEFVEGGSSVELSFRDLAIDHGLREPGATRYRWRARVVEGPDGVLSKALREGPAVAGVDRQRVRIPLGPGASGSGDRWAAVVEVTALGSGGEERAARVVLEGGAGSAVRVVGLRH